MEQLLTRNTASLTEFREPGKVLAKAGQTEAVFQLLFFKLDFR